MKKIVLSIVAIMTFAFGSYAQSLIVKTDATIPSSFRIDLTEALAYDDVCISEVPLSDDFVEGPNDQHTFNLPLGKDIVGYVELDPENFGDPKEMGSCSGASATREWNNVSFNSTFYDVTAEFTSGNNTITISAEEDAQQED